MNFDELAVLRILQKKKTMSNITMYFDELVVLGILQKKKTMSNITMYFNGKIPYLKDACSSESQFHRHCLPKLYKYNKFVKAIN